MLKDCIEILKQKESEYSFSNKVGFYTDSGYILNPGIYCVVDMESLKSLKMIVSERKNKKKEYETDYEYICEYEHSPSCSDFYNKIKMFDFLSGPATVRSKIVDNAYTTNCFSLGVKVNEKGCLLKVNINKYFEKAQEILKDSEYFSDFRKYENSMEEFIRIAKDEINCNLENGKLKKDYFIKIYADLSVEEYSKLHSIYFDNYAWGEEKGFYSSEIRKEHSDNKIPVNFVNLNRKKPFNANKTRKVPAICYEFSQDLKDRELLSKYLQSHSLEKEKFKERYMKVYNDIHAGFGFSDYVVFPETTENFDCCCDNYLKVEPGRYQYGVNITIDDIDKELYNGNLIKYIEGNKLNNIGSRLLSNITEYSCVWVNFFHKKNYKPLKAVFNKVCFSRVWDTFDESLIFLREKAALRFNLVYSIKNYILKKENKKMSDINIFSEIYEKIKEKIERNETLRFDTDEEAFFGMGQIAYFLLYKTKSNIKHDAAVPFLTSVYSESAKNEIFKLFVVRSYDISLKRIIFNNLYAMVQEYRYPKKMNFECVFAGFLHNNVLLSKNNIEKNEEEV